MGEQRVAQVADADESVTVRYLHRNRTENPPKEIVLDFDATGSILYGEQEKRHFSGYYDDYCYTPIYVTCDNYVLFAHLMPSSVAPVKHVIPILSTLVSKLRRAFPRLKITYRGDTGFYSPEIIDWCEENGVDYITGFGVNTPTKYIQYILDFCLKIVEQEFEATQQPSRVFRDFTHSSSRWFKRVYDIKVLSVNNYFFLSFCR